MCAGPYWCTQGNHTLMCNGVVAGRGRPKPSKLGQPIGDCTCGAVLFAKTVGRPADIGDSIGAAAARWSNSPCVAAARSALACYLLELRMEHLQPHFLTEVLWRLGLGDDMPPVHTCRRCSVRFPRGLFIGRSVRFMHDLLQAHMNGECPDFCPGLPTNRAARARAWGSFSQQNQKCEGSETNSP